MEQERARKRRRLSNSNYAVAANGTSYQAVNPSLLETKVIDRPTFGREPGTENTKRIRAIPSPVQLSSVDAIPADCNIDTVSLKDIVGHPLIKECWALNYLIDVDFLLSHFDPDVREQIDLNIVHGSWKKDDSNRAYIEDAVTRHENVKAITAYMPEAFGTHHSKMIITIRHDDIAQVFIFTANLIEQDWNMCQAVWSSPLLPLLLEKDNPRVTDRLGSGLRFKFDLLSYLRAYKNRLQKLISALEQFDFGGIRAALVASTPCRQRLDASSHASTSWGWPGLEKVLDQIPCQGPKPHTVVQISSVATLGVQDTYLRKTIFATLARSLNQRNTKPKFSIVFPTADEIRRSVTGYACGGSIHMKIQTPQQAKQLEYMRPFLCHWAPDLREHDNVRRSGRRRAGPHIKTYIRFSDEEMTKIDWAMVTSANLSKQAWGAETGKDGAVRICSYEIGVIVWPDLWKENQNENIEMVPTFKRDEPGIPKDGSDMPEKLSVTVGFRMPYDLPLVPYTATEEPWCATKSYIEPDWMGRSWG